MERERILEDYRRLAREVDGQSAVLRARHPTEVHCGTGCNACCHDFFEVSVLEAAVVRGAIEELPAEAAARIQERIAGVDRRFQELGPDGGRHYLSEDREASGRTYALRQRLPEPERLCPLHLDGGCSIYASRPIVCRTFGYPVDGWFLGCPGGNFEDEDAEYGSLEGEGSDLRLEALREAFVAGTDLEGHVTDNRNMAADDWETP